MEKMKENVFIDFYDMIRKSWTFQKLTEKEQNKINGKEIKEND